MSHTCSVFVSPLVHVRDSICRSGKSGCSEARGGDCTHVTLIRRGCFNYHLGTRVFLADSSIAYIYDEGTEYRSSHPCDGGDDCTLFDLDKGLLAEIFGSRRKYERREFQMNPSAQLSHLAAYNVFGESGGDLMVCEEAAIGLMHTVAHQAPIADGLDKAHVRQLRFVNQTKGFLNDNLAENLDLSTVAREVGCSPYHLMRVFKAETGMALRGYRARLRAAAALERLAGGADDLTELALDVGFASHSHLTDTFRAIFGAPPSQIREQLAHGGLNDKRRFLQETLRSAA